MRIKKILKRKSWGACCGIAATVPMTAAMLIIQRLLPASQREPIEPQQVTDSLIDALPPTEKQVKEFESSCNC